MGQYQVIFLKKTLQAANYMYNRFKKLGVPVTITRDTDKTLSRAERLNTMRSLGTDHKP